MLEAFKVKAGRYCHGYQSDDFQLEGQYVWGGLHMEKTLL